jgi:RNA polymerase sigma-70 factor, ECF subfamily
MAVKPEDLLKQARKFDQEALALIHDQYYPVVYRYVRFRLDDEAACEDIASEVFTRFLQALKRPEQKIDDLRGWLLGTSANLIHDAFRKQYRRPQEPLDDHEALPDLQTAETMSDRKIARDELRLAMQRLTEDQQHVLALRFSQECSLEETARQVGKTVNAVKVLQFRALAALRRILVEKTKE